MNTMEAEAMFEQVRRSYIAYKGHLMRVSGHLEKSINRVMHAASPTFQDAADLEDYRLKYKKHFNSIIASLEKLVMLMEGKEDLWM